MDDPTPAAVANPVPATPQVSPAPVAPAPTLAAPAQPAEPQFDPRKWAHMKEILDRDPQSREKVLSDLGGVSMQQYLTDHKQVLCNTLGIPVDKQYLVAGTSVAELAKSANDIAVLLKPAGNPLAANPLAPSAPPPQNDPIQIAPATAEPRKIASVDDAADVYAARMKAAIG